MTIAFSLIVLGTLMLLQNLGYVSMEIWPVIGPWWPLLLIFGGVEIFLQKKLWGRILFFFFALGASYAIISYALTFSRREFQQSFPRNFLQDLDRRVRRFR